MNVRPSAPPTTAPTAAPLVEDVEDDYADEEDDEIFVEVKTDRFLVALGVPPLRAAD